jgi:RNA polymerase sigma factor (sigma-70 family)
VNTNHKIAIIQKFEFISRKLAKKWGRSEAWDEIYSDMCCAFLKKERKLVNKPTNYIIKACTNEAINNYLSGKSICSRPRNGIKIISIESVSENIPTRKRFEKHVHAKIFVEHLFNILSRREKQVAQLLMHGYTETEIAKELLVSQQRVNRIKKSIRSKATKVIRRGGVF